MSVILYEKQDNIGIITLNRPDKRNALNTELLNGLGDYLHQANDDPEVKVIVILLPYASSTAVSRPSSSKNNVSAPVVRIFCCGSYSISLSVTAS